MRHFHLKWTGHVTPSVTFGDVQLVKKRFNNTFAIYIQMDTSEKYFFF